jgi:ribonuclease J
VPNTRGSSAGELLFLPLGGAGEIGMNLNLFGYAGKWLMVDLGVTFGDDSSPGVEVVMPDPGWIEARRSSLLGIVATHAHEDHIGAVPYLWPRLNCPIYATQFTAAVIRRKLRDADLLRRVDVIEIPTDGRFIVGPFDVELIQLTHSIPEPMALAIRTPAGLVLHTGDWKFDPHPLIGPRADEAALRRVGKEGVLALVGDSTNVFRPGEAGSEASVRKRLQELIGRCASRVAVACFASNIARLESIAVAARANGRHTAVIGRSLWRMLEAARECGYLKDLPDFVSEEDANYLPRSEIVMVCTGSQGEARAALARIAEDAHPHVTLEAGDTAIFSSRIIPGNEKAIGRLQNKLSLLGVEIVTERDDEHVHVSGHPARDELSRMYHWVRPRIAVPVHGEARHLVEHAKLAKECQVPEAVVVENGAMVRLAPGPAEIVDRVPSGRLGVDGKRLVPMDGSVVQARRRLMRNGAASVTLVVGRDGSLKAEPVVSLHGIVDGEDDGKVVDAAPGVVRDAVEALSKVERRDDQALREAARVALRRWAQAALGKRPPTDVQVVRL